MLLALLQSGVASTNMRSMATERDSHLGLEDVRRADILHADLDAFYASVEQRDNPALRGRPVIVGGGVVLAASYEARRLGVRTAMNGRDARRLCPNAVVVSPRMSAYSEASKAVFEIFDDVSPLVEPISIDEAFIDVSGLHRLVGPAPEIATSLRGRIRSDVGLPISIGIATTKFLAKVASVSAKPDGLWVVPAGSELEFLHPAPGAQVVGRREGDRREAGFQRDRQCGPGRCAEPRAAERDSRCRVWPPPSLSRSQPRPKASRWPESAPFYRCPAIAGHSTPNRSDRSRPSAPRTGRQSGQPAA